MGVTKPENTSKSYQALSGPPAISNLYSKALELPPMPSDSINLPKFIDFEDFPSGSSQNLKSKDHNHHEEIDVTAIKSVMAKIKLDSSQKIKTDESSSRIKFIREMSDRDFL